MRTLKQIEAEFRDLDAKEGRINKFYEKSKVSALKNKNVRIGNKRIDNKNFWDVLQPKSQDLESNEYDGKSSTKQAADQHSVTVGRRKAPADKKKRRVFRRKKTEQQKRVEALKAQQEEIKRKEAARAKSLRDSRKIHKHVSNLTQDYTTAIDEELRRRRSSIAQTVNKMYGYEGDIHVDEEQPAQLPQQHPSNMVDEDGFADETLQNRTSHLFNADPTPGEMYIGPRRGSLVRSSNEPHDPMYLKPNTRTVTNHANSYTNSVRRRSSTPQVHQVDSLAIADARFDNPSFYFFKIKIHKHVPHMDLVQADEIFMYITQDDNPNLAIKIHDLSLNDDNTIVFQFDDERQETIFSPVDNLPWVSEPRDLLGHFLTVEVFVRTSERASIIAKSIVRYAETDGLAPTTFKNQTAAKKYYAQKREQESLQTPRAMPRTSVVDDEVDDQEKPTDHLTVLKMKSKAPPSSNMPTPPSAVDSSQPKKRIKVLSINMDSYDDDTPKDVQPKDDASPQHDPTESSSFMLPHDADDHDVELPEHLEPELVEVNDDDSKLSRLDMNELKSLSKQQGLLQPQLMDVSQDKMTLERKKAELRKMRDRIQQRLKAQRSTMSSINDDLDDVL